MVENEFYLVIEVPQLKRQQRERSLQVITEAQKKSQLFLKPKKKINLSLWKVKISEDSKNYCLDFSILKINLI